MKTCEDYRAALIDAAAEGSAPSRELRLHLDACASCRSAFAEESQLFAAIDTGLHAAANAELPASLLLRVRAELGGLSVPRFSWAPSGAAIAAVAAVVLTVVFVRGIERSRVEPNPQTASVARNNVAVQANMSLSAHILEPNAPPARQSRTRSVKSSPAKREALAVLVPAGQKRAMEALLASLRQGKVAGESLLAEKAQRPLEELQVAPLDVTPIEVKPLGDMSAESDSQNEKTNR